MRRFALMLCLAAVSCSSPQAGKSDGSTTGARDGAVSGGKDGSAIEKDAEAPGPSLFVVGYNFGDPTTPDATLEGHTLVAKDETSTRTLRLSAGSQSVMSWPTDIAPTAFVPQVDAELAKVLNHHLSVAGGGILKIEQGLKDGTYQVFTYHLENNASVRSYELAVQGTVVTSTPVQLEQFHWAKLGPFEAQVEGGVLTVELRGSQDSLIAGMEIWSTTGGAVQDLPSTPAQTDAGTAETHDAGAGRPDAALPASPDASMPGSPDAGAGLSPVDMTGWTLFFEDTFPGTSLDTSKWRQYGTCPSGTPPIWFNNGGIAVDDGFVGTLWSQDGQWYGPGLQTWTGELYYRAEIKAQIPKGNGLGPYFLMWPQTDEWPPEFDLVETPGDTSQVMTTWHWKDANGDHRSAEQFYDCDRTQWHVYTVEHTASGFRFWIDGVEKPTPSAWVDNNDKTHVMNFGIGAVAFPDGADWYGKIDSTTPDPYHFYVAYVRMWKQE